MPIFGHALPHGTVELFKAVAANTLLLIRRDVGGIDIPYRRGELHPARQFLTTRSRMASRTVPCLGHIFTGGHGVSRATSQ
ncbi:hypothetical protein D3C76_1414320 [compost metagenome]